ncbi:probable LRR receptor-like serine/threonine-protein kinase RFK1 [Gossypium hirsutum]|uniref:Probable LRR receptor-like serine/threonine-protein kinase RFK1 n=1 Tax=Gossypium hirsutum TaxID=3635 RepID=A0ABM3A132_GOSHI|nr:probable LRR receptor-like serine/threonine-protein kinase RFK1 [Gossypium hirsutum]
MFFPKPIAFLLSVLLSFIWLRTNKLDAATLPQNEERHLPRYAYVSFPEDKTIYKWVKRITDIWVCFGVFRIFKHQNLPGGLPPELVNLPYLKVIDFAYNYLNGSIPLEWASMQLEYIYYSLLELTKPSFSSFVFVNRLSGSIPTYLGNITSLAYLDLEANQFSGQVPPEIGKLVNLRTLRLSYNRLTGDLPVQLAELKNLTDFRINDNNFNGSIPTFFQNWKNLRRILSLHSFYTYPSNYLCLH